MKNLIIFALSLLTANKLIRSKNNCYTKPHWYYFNIDKINKKINVKCKKVNSNDKFFVVFDENGVNVPIEIDFNSEFGKLIRISFAEGYQGELADQPLNCFTAISEVVRNRVNSTNYPDTYA